MTSAPAVIGPPSSTAASVVRPTASRSRASTSAGPAVSRMTSSMPQSLVMPARPPSVTTTISGLEMPVVQMTRHSDLAMASSRRASTMTTSACGASTRAEASAGRMRTWCDSSPSAGTTSALGAKVFVSSSRWAIVDQDRRSCTAAKASNATLRRCSSGTGRAPGPRPPTRRSNRCCRSARSSSVAARARAATRCRPEPSSRSSRRSPGDDGRMPRVDDQPTDLSREAEPAQSETVEGGAEQPASEPEAAPGEPVVETRAQRRARQEAVLKEPVLPALATVRRPIAVIATIVLAALLVLALLADPVLLAAGLAWAGIVVAWGWPTLLGSSSRFGSSLAIGVTGVLAPVAAVATTDEPYLRLVPVALVIGLAIMFGHQMVRRDGRPRLTESIGITSLGLAVVALGTTWMPLSRTDRASDIALIGFVAIAVASLADLVAGFTRVRPWMLPLAMLLGGAGAMVAASVIGSPAAGPAALVGFLCAAVSHATRRLLSVLPAVTSVRGQLSTAAASLLVPGVVAYGLALAIVG